MEDPSIVRSRSDLSRSVPPPHLSGITPERRRESRRNSRGAGPVATPERRRSRQASGQTPSRDRYADPGLEEDYLEEDAFDQEDNLEGNAFDDDLEENAFIGANETPTRAPRSRRDRGASQKAARKPPASKASSRAKTQSDDFRAVPIGSAALGSRKKKPAKSREVADVSDKDAGSESENEMTPASPVRSRRGRGAQTHDYNGALAGAAGATGAAVMANGGRDDRRRNWGRRGRAQAAAGQQEGTQREVRDSEKSGFGAMPSGHPTSVDKKGRVYSLTGIDNLALLMEDDGYQTACYSMYLFKTELDYETVVQFFQQLAQAYPKYRYVVELDPSVAKKKDKAALRGIQSTSEDPKFDPGRKTLYSKTLAAGSHLRPAKWRLDETFDIEENIQVVKAPGDGTDEDLFELCGQVLGTHFDYSKPLWEAVLVHGLNTSEGARSGLMIKIHHAFSDGQGMIQSYHSALEAMSKGKSIGAQQDEIDRNALQGAQAKKNAEKRPGGKEEEQKKVGSRGVKPTMLGTVSHSWHTVRGLYFRKRTAFTYSDKAAKHAVDIMGGKLAKNGRPSGRFYGHSDGIKMDDIKLIRKAFSTAKADLTLNDVACALLSRALRIAAEDLAARQGKKVRDKRVAVFIPVSKRPPGDWSLANYTTGAIAWFRFHSPDKFGFQKLVEQCNREMTRIKKSHLPTMTFKLFNAVCKRRIMMMPNYPVVRSFFQRAYTQYCVFTNIPGPAKPVRFGEHEAFSYHCLPPSSPGRSTMAIGTISYGGAFSLAVSCDAIEEWDQEHLDLPGTICDAFQEASEELIAAAKDRLRTG